ncbi:FAD-binding oxidoreductase [Cellvibrio sp. ARAG 10.3]|uniref:FAD-binding oxidoreductase n=1 Tax=Cellvibrio sp. ARAG 10.3 TaxID=3451358 RepID=UPI003F488DC8
MTTPTVQSWGRYPNLPQAAHVVEWRDRLSSLFNQLITQHEITLPYGNGRSYGDSCLSLSDHVINVRGLNRFIATDWENGVIVAEAGVTLEEILKVSIPRGWFLPVTPGTKFVTLGGAIANDVHGKNHHVRGTFGSHVKRFGLLRSDAPACTCSSLENQALYKATIGGLGLTGIIDWVELQLIPIESSQIATTTIRFDSLEEFIQLSNELDHQHEYSVAWIDCAAKGKAIGRGVFMVGDHCPSGELIVHSPKKWNVPLTPPISAINQITLNIFNYLYFHKHSADRVFSLSDYDPFFYPLDSISNWNRIYGPRGFQQYQCVIPGDNAQSSIHEILKTISSTGCGSFLAVLKRCGDVPSPGLMSFPMPGISLALDFAQSSFVIEKLFPALDLIVREGGGRIYPAKDAHMSAKDFQSYYPQWEALNSLRDPHICSHFWKRVTSV